MIKVGKNLLLVGDLKSSNLRHLIFLDVWVCILKTFGKHFWMLLLSDTLCVMITLGHTVIRFAQGVLAQLKQYDRWRVKLSEIKWFKWVNQLSAMHKRQLNRGQNYINLGRVRIGHADSIVGVAWCLNILSSFATQCLNNYYLEQLKQKLDKNKLKQKQNKGT